MAVELVVANKVDPVQCLHIFFNWPDIWKIYIDKIQITLNRRFLDSDKFYAMGSLNFFIFSFEMFSKTPFFFY